MILPCSATGADYPDAPASGVHDCLRVPAVRAPQPKGRLTSAISGVDPDMIDCVHGGRVSERDPQRTCRTGVATVCRMPNRRAGRVSTSNPDLDAVAARAETVDNEPVVMVNLIKFKSPEHFQRFASESQRTAEYIRALGAERVFGGIAGPEFCADEDWDLVLLIRYPNFAAVHRTLTEESIGSFVASLRDDTIERSRFISTTELPLA